MGEGETMSYQIYFTHWRQEAADEQLLPTVGTIVRDVCVTGEDAQLYLDRISPEAYLANVDEMPEEFATAIEAEEWLSAHHKGADVYGVNAIFEVR
jgi:hypothetical protein